MVKVLITDDSAFMRKAISIILEKDPGISVVGYARNGEDAIEKVKNLKPDILTLDVEMPGMNGLDALRVIMAENPLPVLMISSITKDGAEVTFQALELGALDYITKDLSYASLDIMKFEDEIRNKVKLLSRKKVFPKKQVEKPVNKILTSKPAKLFYRNRIKIIAIGSSTGGPGALQVLLTEIPEDIPASIMIAQHMPQGFTKTFANRLNNISKIKVKEAENNDSLENGTAYIAPGNTQMSLKKEGSKLRISITDEPRNTLYRPSINFMISSIANIYGNLSIGVILTGMGNDGLEGIREIKKKKGYAFAQDEKSSIIYGMPKAIVDAGLADKICPIQEMAYEIVNFI